MSSDVTQRLPRFLEESCGAADLRVTMTAPGCTVDFRTASPDEIDVARLLFGPYVTFAATQTADVHATVVSVALEAPKLTQIIEQSRLAPARLYGYVHGYAGDCASPGQPSLRAFSVTGTRDLTLYDTEARLALRLRAKGTSSDVLHLEQLLKYPIRLGAASRGFINLHASAWSCNGTTVAAVGNKGTGKSTLVMSMLASGAAYLANDGIFLNETSSGWELVAWPHIVRLEDGTIDGNPRLSPLRSSEFAADLPPELRPFRGPDGKLQFYPFLLDRLFGCGAPLSEASLDHVVAPSFDLENAVAELGTSPVPWSDCRESIRNHEWASWLDPHDRATLEAKPADRARLESRARPPIPFRFGTGAAEPARAILARFHSLGPSHAAQRRCTRMRVLLLICDGLGVGEAPDAARYDSLGSNTLRSVHGSPKAVRTPTLDGLGLYRLLEHDGISERTRSSCVGRLYPTTAGLDSLDGHRELLGDSSTNAPPCYPDGLPAELLSECEAVFGRPLLGNVAGDGHAVLEQYGAEHLRSGSPIVYTSAAGSVVQFAGHAAVVSWDQMVEWGWGARELFHRSAAVNRIIVRQFVGEPGAFSRVRRFDLPSVDLPPTYLSQLRAGGVHTSGVGKVADMVDPSELSTSIRPATNAAVLRAVEDELEGGEASCIVATLDDFDSVYGHRRDVPGYRAALEAFDSSLDALMRRLTHSDLLVVTADHGNDPTYAGNHHTREWVPLVAWSPALALPPAFPDAPMSSLPGLIASWLFGDGGSAGPIAIASSPRPPISGDG